MTGIDVNNTGTGIFKPLLKNLNRQSGNGALVVKKINHHHFSLTSGGGFTIFYIEPFNDPYLLNALVNIAVNILIRNFTRAGFILEREGVELKSGIRLSLFRRPNKHLTRYGLWKETVSRRFLEGGAFWRAGTDYSGKLPKLFFILNLWRMQSELPYSGGVYDELMNRRWRWLYQCQGGITPILSDELIRFKGWNPRKPLRALIPLFSFPPNLFRVISQTKPIQQAAFQQQIKNP